MIKSTNTCYVNTAMVKNIEGERLSQKGKKGKCWKRNLGSGNVGALRDHVRVSPCSRLVGLKAKPIN